MNDGYVKEPDAALRFILPFDKLRAGLAPVTVSPTCPELVEGSKRMRLACGLFTKPFHFQDLLRGRHE
jgi:hypothetical protein